jgi:hypothetical protein
MMHGLTNLKILYRISRKSDNGLVVDTRSQTDVFFKYGVVFPFLRRKEHMQCFQEKLYREVSFMT